MTTPIACVFALRETGHRQHRNARTAELGPQLSHSGASCASQADKMNLRLTLAD